MQAIILAAGIGKRLSKVTNNNIPKSFLEIEGRRLIDYHLDNLVTRGITDITFVVGYKKNLFIDTFGSEYRGVTIHYVEVPKYDLYNHSWSISLTKETCNKINKDVIVLHADTFFDPKILDILLDSEDNNLILADMNYTLKTNDEMIVYGNDGNITGLHYIDENMGNGIGEFIGLHKFNLDSFNKYLDYLNIMKKWDVGYDRMLVESGIKLNYKTIENLSWININHSEDYDFAKNYVFRKAYRDIASLPNSRRKMLRRLITSNSIVRILEAHNGLTGLIVEKTKVNDTEFDGMWLSSLTHSASKGRPDNQYVDITTVSHTLNEIFDVTTKPIIVDLDNGGLVEHFKPIVRTLERLGVSAVIIEDKIGNKRNSLFDDTSNQLQDTIEDFSFKISEGKKSLVTKDFMIIARVESFILGNGLEDAIERTKAYIEAGADGIMIHSKSKTSDEIISFCKKYKDLKKVVPLVVVPSTYNKVTEKELTDIGVNVVIYANHLLRSSYPAMVDTATSILQNKRSYEANDKCLSIKKVLELIPND